MINFFSKYKIFFYLSNFTLIILYLFPGSLLGCIFFKNCKVQPQITSDFIISSNHFYAFGLITILGYFTYLNSKKLNFVIKYLVLLAIILEIFHFFIPDRSFQFSDLFGNLLGVCIIILINFILKKNEIFR
jgi:VanZ family protein